MRPAAEGVHARAETRPGPLPVPAGSAAAPAGARTLARAIGNRAFTRLAVTAPILQRVGGWSGGAAAANRAETSASGYRRIPVTGLNPVDRALVLIAPTLDPTQPVDVLVHLHGQNHGYDGDPPRDLDAAKDRFEAQLAAAGRPQLVAVLPQGSTTGADYGEFARLNPRTYAADALAKVAALDAAAAAGAQRQAPSVRSVILSGHSGGGFAIKAILDRPALARDLGGVVWFDAVQAQSTITATGARVSTGQREAAKMLIATRIAAELDAAGSSASPGVALATGFWFRLYYDASGWYGSAAQEVDAYLKALFGEAGRAPGRDRALAARIAALDPGARAGLRARYQVLPIPRTSDAAAAAAAGMGTTGHENVIGSGALENALRTMPFGAAPAATGSTGATPAGGSTSPPPVPATSGGRLGLGDTDPDHLMTAGNRVLATAASGSPARTVLARQEDVAARLVDAAAGIGRDGGTAQAGRSLLSGDYIRTTLQGRGPDTKLARTFDVHVQALQRVDEGAAREARYGSEAGLLVVELEDMFIHDPTKSAIDLLAPDRTRHYRGINWGRDDYPGNGGAQAGEAAAMAREMAAIRPERRPNVGGASVISQVEMTANLSRLRAHLKSVDGQPGATLFDEAADQFSYMAAIAALDAVTLRILSSWRDPATAARNAAAAGNPAAVAAYSSHSLGLAVDLEMSGGGQHFMEIQTHPMSNVFAMRSSEVHKWMVLRGGWFGWYPYGNEPWHWEYNPVGLRDRYRTSVLPQRSAPPAPTGAAAAGASA